MAGLVLKSGDSATTYVAGTDYSANLVTGELARIKGGAISAGASVKASYDYADPTKVTAGDIIGAVNAAGARTGLKALKDTYNQFGFFAKILIAPAFCTQNSVAVELIAMADQLDAVTYLDAPIGTTYAQALAGRGPAGSINFNTSSDRVRLCYPHVKVYDPVLNAERLEPLSARAAGLRAKVDLDKGFWWCAPTRRSPG